MKRFLLILTQLFLAASLNYSLDVEIVTGEAGRTVWIIHDLSSCFRRSAYPEYLFALTREDFEATTVALTEYEALEEDYQALDRAYDECERALVAANKRINAANAALARYERRHRRDRILVLTVGGIAVGLGAATAVLAVLYAREKP